MCDYKTCSLQGRCCRNENVLHSRCRCKPSSLDALLQYQPLPSWRVAGDIFRSACTEGQCAHLRPWELSVSDFTRPTLSLHLRISSCAGMKPM